MAKKKAVNAKTPTKGKVTGKPVAKPVSPDLIAEWEAMPKKQLAELVAQRDKGTPLEKALRWTKAAMVEHLEKLAGKPQPQNLANAVEAPLTTTPESQPEFVPPEGSFLERLQQTCPGWFSRLGRIRDQLQWEQNPEESRATSTPYGIAKLFNIAFAVMTDCRVRSYSELDQMVRLPFSWHSRRYNTVVRRVLGQKLNRDERETANLITEALRNELEEFRNELAPMSAVDAQNTLAEAREEMNRGASLYQELQD